ncbi:MAG: reverse transcriptase domain-containing protein [Terracidiphilus sp.]
MGRTHLRGASLGRAERASGYLRRAQTSAETRAEIKKFAEDVPLHIDRIQRQLSKNLFVFKPAKGVKAKKKGKAGFRPLVIAPVESRIVQRAVHDVLLSLPAIEAIVRTPYSFGGVRKGEEDELSSVPAAIKAVLVSIGDGASYLIKSDISKFFTRIPKSEVRKIVEAVISECSFLTLFDNAVAAELSNMQELQGYAHEFPIGDIGVAQGNSLSPLLGNLLLKDFDAEMNALPDIRCIRFIDDFVILGPNKSVTMEAFRRAQGILGQWQMALADNKTQSGSVEQRFEFLGIEFNNGFLRPSKAARLRFLTSIEDLLDNGQRALIDYKDKHVIEKRSTLLRTLATLSETVYAWAMSYSFCNDAHCLRQLDQEIERRLGKYFATYRSIRNNLGSSSTRDLLGIQSLEKCERQSFAWPKKAAGNSWKGTL